MQGLWIRVAANIGSRKVVWRLMSSLGLSRAAAVGHLVMLWGGVVASVEVGRVDDVPDELLEEWAGWRGEAGVFATWVREKHVTAGVINEWDEYAGKLEERREKDRRRKSEERAKDKPKKSKRRPADSPKDTPRDFPRTIRNETVRTEQQVQENTSPDGEVSGAGAPPAPSVPEANGKGKALARVAPMGLAAVQQRLIDTQLAVATRLQAGKKAWEHAEQLVRYKITVAFAYWQHVCDHPRAGLDPTAAKLLRQHLKWSVTDPVGDLSFLLYVVDGARKSEWHQGTDAKGANTGKRDWLPQLFGTRQAAQQLAEKCKGYRDAVPHEYAAEYLRPVTEIETVEAEVVG